MPSDKLPSDYTPRAGSRTQLRGDVRARVGDDAVITGCRLPRISDPRLLLPAFASVSGSGARLDRGLYKYGDSAHYPATFIGADTLRRPPQS